MGVLDLARGGVIETTEMLMLRCDTGVIDRPECRGVPIPEEEVPALDEVTRCSPLSNLIKQQRHVKLQASIRARIPIPEQVFNEITSCIKSKKQKTLLRTKVIDKPIGQLPVRGALLKL